MFESPDCQVIRKAFQQFYENRSQLQSQRVYQVIKQAFPQASSQKIKLYSFFAVIIESQDDLQKKLRNYDKYKVNGPLYLIQQNQREIFEKYQIVHKINLAKFDLQKFTLCIAPENKIKCQMLNSIEEQIKWLQNNQYFEDIQKKRLYHLLRNAEILTYTFNSNVYCEGQTLQQGQTSLFLVKQGEFCLKKNNKTQSLMLYDFGAGEMFGHQELLSNHTNKKRLFTVNCRSSYGIVYKISEDFFNYYLKKSCEDNLRINIQKVSKFISKHLEKVQISRQKNELLLTQTTLFRKSTSIENNNFVSAPKLLKSSRMMLEDIVEEKTKRDQKLPFISTKSQFDVNNHVRREKITISNPEYQQDAELMNRKIKLETLRSYTKSKTSESRGEILLNLIKNSWHFQRNRKKKILVNS